MCPLSECIMWKYTYVHLLSPPFLPFRRPARISSSTHPHDLSVFLSISMLARAVGSNVESQIREMLEPMFSAGLSPELTSALRIVSQEIPGLQREIQGQLSPACLLQPCKCPNKNHSSANHSVLHNSWPQRSVDSPCFYGLCIKNCTVS